MRHNVSPKDFFNFKYITVFLFHHFSANTEIFSLMDAENSRQIYKNSIQDAVLPSRMYMNGIVFNQKDTLSCPVGK